MQNFLPNKIFKRQISLFNNCLIAGFPLLNDFSTLKQIHFWSWDLDLHEQINHIYPNLSFFGVTPPKSKKFNSAVLYIPKSKALTYYLIDQLKECTFSNTIYLVGENKSAIESIGKNAKKYGYSKKIDSAGHSQIWEINFVNKPNPRNLSQLKNTISFQIDKKKLNIVTLPGVFSENKIDIGSHLLLNNLPKIDKGRSVSVLDFGCGSGIIGAVIKTLYPNSNVTLIDIDAFALEAARLTCEINNINVNIIPCSNISNLTQKFNFIISNPPFHKGLSTYYKSTEYFLSNASSKLAPNGELRVVANNFLKYQPLIEKKFNRCTIVSNQDGFKIYSAM